VCEWDRVVGQEAIVMKKSRITKTGRQRLTGTPPQYLYQALDEQSLTKPHSQYHMLFVLPFMMGNAGHVMAIVVECFVGVTVWHTMASRR